jgi:cyanophycinase
MAAVALLGSGEFLPWARPVDEWCVARATAPSDRVLVVPTASAPEGAETFERWGRSGVEHYAEMGLSPEVVPLRTRADAQDPAVAAMVEGARYIFFSGGNPGYLAETLADTAFWDNVRAAAGSGATALGGCSAGAVAFGVLAPFVANDGVERMVDGLKVLARAFVLPHFDMLDQYQPGLRATFLGACPDGATPVGIDENTALYGDGERWHVTGAGAAWIGHDLVPYRDGDEAAVSLGLALP